MGVTIYLVTGMILQVVKVDFCLLPSKKNGLPTSQIGSFLPGGDPNHLQPNPQWVQ